MKGSYFILFILLSMGSLSSSQAAIFGLGKGRGDLDVRLYNRYPRPNPVRFRGLGAKEPAGIVVTARGSSWRIPEQGEVLPLNLRTSVYVPDHLRTDRNASLKVALIDNSVLAMTGESEVWLKEYIFSDQEQQARLSFEKGVLGFLIGDMALYAPENVVIDTGVATIGIRGSGGFLRWLERAVPTLEIATISGHVLDVRLPGGQHVVLDEAQRGLRVDALGNMEIIPIPQAYFSFQSFDAFLGVVTRVIAGSVPAPFSNPPLRQAWPFPFESCPWRDPLAELKIRRSRTEIEDLALSHFSTIGSGSELQPSATQHQFRLSSLQERERPSSLPLLERLAREQGLNHGGKGLRPDGVERESASSLLVLKSLGLQWKETEAQRRMSLESRDSGSVT